MRAERYLDGIVPMLTKMPVAAYIALSLPALVYIASLLCIYERPAGRPYIPVVYSLFSLVVLAQGAATAVVNTICSRISIKSYHILHVIAVSKMKRIFFF